MKALSNLKTMSRKCEAVIRSRQRGNHKQQVIDGGNHGSHAVDDVKRR